jgi:endonuclease I
MQYRLFVVFFFLVQYIGISAQHIDIFPGFTGNELLSQVVQQYKPSVVLPYDEARDILFGSVDKKNDSLECIYSGHKVYLPPGQDPTTAAYQNGSNNGINTEHTYPQSMWSGGNSPKSDMHHLFPTRSLVNNVRGSDPFGEISDNFTDKWYYKDTETSSIPPADVIDLYSEDTNSFFEPREASKGNIARAMFYFYTMYRNESNAISSAFFQNQLPTLCQWHEDDPVDFDEAVRNWKISAHQQDKPNPFVLDCSLASRANYCSGISDYCDWVVSQEEILLENSINLSPNPAKDLLNINISEDVNMGKELNITCFDVSGKLLKQEIVENNGQIEMTIENLPKGIILVRIQGDKNVITKKIIRQ